MTHSAPGPGPRPDHGTDSGPGPDANPAKPADPRLGRLLRWYPRTWRKRYGDEFLVMVEDTLDGRPPGWRLHLGVAWAGLRERARRVRPAALRRMMTHDRYRPLHPGRHAKDASPKPVSWLSTVAATAMVSLFWFDQKLIFAPLWADARRHARGTVAANVLTGLFVVAGAAIAVAALAAGPALARFLRAGGWPGVRRPVTEAVVGTVVAMAVLTPYIIMAGSLFTGPAVRLAAALAWFIAILLSLLGALQLWGKVATAMAGQLELEPRVRAVQVVLNAVAATAVHALLPVGLIWSGQVAAHGWTVALGVLLVAGGALSDIDRLWWAWRQARELRAATAEGR
jgi:hypothetical protein